VNVIVSPSPAMRFQREADRPTAGRFAWTNWKRSRHSAPRGVCSASTAALQMNATFP
jgi:hypothetical protein